MGSKQYGACHTFYELSITVRTMVDIRDIYARQAREERSDRNQKLWGGVATVAAVLALSYFSPHWFRSTTSTSQPPRAKPEISNAEKLKNRLASIPSDATVPGTDFQFPKGFIQSTIQLNIKNDQVARLQEQNKPETPEGVLEAMRIVNDLRLDLIQIKRTFADFKQYPKRSDELLIDYQRFLNSSERLLLLEEGTYRRLKFLPDSNSVFATAQDGANTEPSPVKGSDLKDYKDRLSTLVYGSNRVAFYITKAKEDRDQ